MPTWRHVNMGLEKYVVAFLNLGNGELKQTLVSAYSRRGAYRLVLDTEFGADYWRDHVPDSASTDDVEEMVFNCDCYISALKISS